jgi:predicted thioredoxin/glutaredoxin
LAAAGAPSAFFWVGEDVDSVRAAVVAGVVARALAAWLVATGSMGKVGFSAAVAGFDARDASNFPRDSVGWVALWVTPPSRSFEYRPKAR